MSKQPITKIISPSDSASDLVNSVVIVEEIEKVEPSDEQQLKVQVFKRKPLIVKARQIHEKVVVGGVYFHAGDWVVIEAGIEVGIKKDDFANLYDVMDVDKHSGAAIDAGLPDVELGTIVEQQLEDEKRRRLIRVEVLAGKGQIAYWANGAPNGKIVGYKVVADITENAGASHRVGLFIEAYDGKPGGRSWVVLNRN